MQLTSKQIRSCDQFYENWTALYCSLDYAGEDCHYEGFLDDEVAMAGDEHYTVA